MDKRLHFPGGMESHFGFTEFCSVQLFCELNNSQLSCELEFMRELLYPDFLFIRGQITPSPYAKGAALFWIRPAPCAHKVMSIQTGGSSPRFQPGPFLHSNFEMLQIESETSMESVWFATEPPSCLGYQNLSSALKMQCCLGSVAMKK